MDSSPLQSRQDIIESWDDDGDLQCSDDIQFRNVSAATSVTGSSARPSGHRDSISSRRSFRSDSNFGDDENWQLSLNDNDETETQDAIASAKEAGVPIPANVPRSALIGGTIKRLGGRKIKRTIGDDWSDDLDISNVDGALKLKTNDKSASPESSHQLSLFSSPTKDRDSDVFDFSPTSPSPPSKTVNSLEHYRDTEEDGSFHDIPTIKIAKSRPGLDALKGTSSESKKEEENFDDLELPAEGEPLRLSVRRESAKTPDPLFDDFDAEWAEGSIGVRFGGTRRAGRSNRSSSISALSPSASSCLTMESEDDMLDGLQLPDGPLSLSNALQKTQQTPPSRPPERPAAETSPKPSPSDDFFSGIDIGDGDIFDPGKLTLNRNIKHKVSRPTSPAARRTATTITFTNKGTPPNTRIPRLSGHERPHSTHLEPVSETGAPVPKFRRPNSRLSGHGAHSSLSSIPLPSTSSLGSTSPSHNRRMIGTRASGEQLRTEPTTTGSQLLKAKRSAPTMHTPHQPATVQSSQRGPSRLEGSSRPMSIPRPKTPIDRAATESRLAVNRRPQIPFVPAGATQNQSHNITSKSLRNFRRTDSDSSNDMYTRSTSRLSNLNRPDTPGRSKAGHAPESLILGAKQTITRPNRRRHFGDGTELDAFDDLPTSATTESKFEKVPIKRGAPRSLRSKLSQSHIVPPSRTDTPVPSQPPSSPFRQESTPRFARDTNASRNARQQRIASMATFHAKDRDSAPLAPLSTNWKAQIPPRPASNTPTLRSRRAKAPNKPQLIKPMGAGVLEPKSVKGMRYNPALYRWDGNENATAEFDPAPQPSPKAAPALITNVGAMSGAQVVGSMVFDPQRMCWLKVSSSPSNKDNVTLAPDEEDVLAGLDDLDDQPAKPAANFAEPPPFDDGDAEENSMNMDDRSGCESSDEWPITEEFDVGPEFIKRQRAEEERWKRKVSKWVGDDRRSLGDAWRYAIRDMVRTDSAADNVSAGRH